ncbi:MAG TPA: glycoside hydrolase family 16 protein [Aeromicrobium sp.]|nr:glycoside hydrolase family 16 protein [Aeromicrobium sp.]
MIRIAAFLVVLVAAMGVAVAASGEEPTSSPSTETREVPLPAPLALAERAQKGCGGVLTRRGGNSVWRCVLSDEFDGARLDLTRWSVVTTAEDEFSSGIPPAYACYVYDPRTVSVAGGYLQLSVVKLDDEIQCGGAAAQPTKYIGGAVSTKNRLAQTYGRYEIRARFPTDEDTGLQSSLILVPDDPVYGQSSGEIDIAEYFTEWSDRVIPYVRYDHPGDDPTETTEDCEVDRPDAFHRYALQWTPKRIEAFVDGRRCLSTTWSMGTTLERPAPFDQPFVLSMFEALGVSKAAFDLEDPPDLPATMQIDYVHIWGVRPD